ncbi:hypothetical protein [Micromonospora sp. HUAS LYJ1]|uniref:hypothetical protein n=1 Tax=Micromonospora sp. HUAS LYJ1 TaxID=3061626 RepID=UPI0026722927|nr:hypothetical protein [Micromonospora sp. HUAS LYJ1]WKU07255.1 hypothetical protein Q2K16_09510 [Micromonospora sp. HUAS LYJ1]
MLLLAVVTGCGKREDLGAGGGDGTVAECVVNGGSGRFGLGVLNDDDGVEFGGTLGIDVGAPLLVDLARRGDAVMNSKITSFLLRNVGLESTAAELERDAQEFCIG